MMEMKSFYFPETMQKEARKSARLNDGSQTIDDELINVPEKFMNIHKINYR